MEARRQIEVNKQACEEFVKKFKTMDTRVWLASIFNVPKNQEMANKDESITYKNKGQWKQEDRLK